VSMAYKPSMLHPSREALLFAALVTSHCGGTSESFPSRFVFGAAIAGFQADMGCPTIPADECEDRRSDWYQFVTSTVTRARPRNHLEGDPLSAGPGFYELYEQDLDRAKELGMQSFRFSFEWSRIFPESTAGIAGYDALKAKASARALAAYHAQLQAMKSRGLRPLVTLHHYTLPIWIHDAVGCNTDLDRCRPRGWLEPTIVEEIAKYAGFCAKEFGAEVDWWATENEPLAVIVPGFLQPSDTRSNPPAASLHFVEAKMALFAMIDAHARMYDAIKANDSIDADGDGRAAIAGIVYNVAPTAPKDPAKALDQRAADNIFYLYDAMFLNAVILGKLDEDLKGEASAIVRDDLVGRSDYLGINYYTRIVVEGEDEPLFPAFSSLTTFNPLTLSIGEDYPRGIYESVTWAKAKYPGVPIVITENGADGSSRDVTPFLVEHLEWLKRAIDEGADVRGYHWWTMTDNYEWNHGMTIKLGLYAVDRDDATKARKPRPVADAYRRIMSGRAIPKDLRETNPIEAK
jgi:beta-galactosidase